MKQQTLKLLKISHMWHGHEGIIMQVVENLSLTERSRNRSSFRDCKLGVTYLFELGEDIEMKEGDSPKDKVAAFRSKANSWAKAQKPVLRVNTGTAREGNKKDGKIIGLYVEFTAIQAATAAQTEPSNGHASTQNETSTQEVPQTQAA